MLVERDGDRYVLPLLVLITVDLIAFSSALMTAYALRFSPMVSWVFPPVEYPTSLIYFKLSLFVALVGVICFDRFGLYRFRFGMNRYVGPTGLVVAVVVTYVFVMATLFNYRGYSFSRLTVGLSIPITATFVVLTDLLIRQVYYVMVQGGVGFARTAIVGEPEYCRAVLDHLRATRGSEYQVLGIIDTTNRRGSLKDLVVPILGKFKDIDQIVRAKTINHLIVAGDATDQKTMFGVVEQCRQGKYRFEVVPELFDALSLKMSVEELGEVPTVTFGETPLEGPVARTLKRSVDVLFSSVALMVSGPVMLLIAALIRLDTKGNILFVQERVGSDGKTFKMFKFRSMVHDAEADTGPVWATADDPRRTRVGKWIRRYNVDELPQLINVLLGDMSVVGPRPERPHFVNQFKETIPQYMRRHRVKSGITGWAQVNGLRGDTSVEERTFYDLYYVDNWSFLFDLRILWKTLSSFKNAY